MERAKETRQRLIDAATTTMQRHGYGGLSLDTVAKTAGVSKGGLLHHYPTKEALIEALLSQLFSTFAAKVEAYAAQEPERPGRWLRAYVRATYDDEPPTLAVSAMLLSAIHEQPALLRLVREDAQRWQQLLANDGVAPIRAAVVRQAADAYWSETLIGTAPASQAERMAVRDELLALIEDGGL